MDHRSSVIYGVTSTVGVVYTLGLTIILRILWDYKSRTTEETANLIIGLITVIAVAYAIIIAMISASEWQIVQQCQAAIDKEAFAISDIALASKCLPPEASRVILNALVDYMDQLDEVELPALRTGTYIKTRSEILDAFFQWSCGPRNDASQEKTLLAGQIEMLIDARRERIRTSRIHVPTNLLVLMIVMSFLVQTSFIMYGHSNVLTHCVLSMICLVFIVLVICVFFILNRPFQHKFLVSFHEMNIVSKQLRFDVRTEDSEN